MNRYDMQDLIIEDDNNKSKKPKRVLAIIALIIIILVAGMTIMRSVVGGSENNSTEKTSSKSETIDKELQPVKNPITMTDKNKDDNPDELKPISDDELPTIPLPAPKVEKEEKPVVTETKEEKHAEPVKAQEHKKEVNKRESAPVHKAPKPTHKSSKKVKKETKTKSKPSKPSELFKKHSTTKHTNSVSGKIYYIQVGSFSKTPNHKYIENIKSKGYHYKLFKSGNLIKVRVGPYSSYEEAKSNLANIKSSLGISGFVVRAK